MANYADRRVWMMTAAEAKLDEIRKEQATVDRTNKIYRQATKSIQERVQALYDELATQDPQNRWRFEGLNTPATLKSATALRKKIESAGLTDYVPERLQRRLSVYEVMELDNWYTMTKAGQDAHSTLKSALEAKIKDQGEIWQRALKAGGAGFVGFDRNQVGYMLGENWYGGNFSSRLWDETQANWGKVQEEIAKALASGQDPQVTRRKIAQILVGAHQDGVKGSGGLQYDVERIVRTEMARAATQADIIKWQNEGVDEVQWNATLEANTCEHCKERDGRVYKIKQARDSVPLHPNCRCFLTPYDRTIEENRTDRKRQYKDENGNYELIDWAPISALTKTEDGWKAAKVSAYFFQASPWTTYEPPKTTLKFTGEINEGYTELASRAIQDAINQYPEIGYELKNSYGNTIYEHRGMSATVGNGVDMIGGVVFPSGGNQVGVALAYPSTLSGTAKAIREKMAEIAAKQYAQGFWSTDKVQHTIIHEMGHVLENYIRKRAERKPGETVQEAGDRAILEILQAATGEKGKKNVLQGLTGISRYGSKNISEGFAELFARSMAQDTNLNNKTVAQFVSKLNQVREDLPQRAKATRVKLSTEGQTARIEEITRKAEKAEWIHSEYVKLFEENGIGTEAIPEAMKEKLKTKMAEIKKEADAIFGEEAKPAKAQTTAMPAKARTTRTNPVSKAQTATAKPTGPSTFNDWYDSLSMDEKDVVKEYKGGGYSILSKIQRQDRDDIYWLDDEQYATIKARSDLLKKAVDKFVLPEEKIVWRGIRSESRIDVMGRQSDPQSNEFVKKLKEIKVGETFIDKGFSSTTTDRKIAAGRIYGYTGKSPKVGDSLLVRIKVPAGKGIAAELDDFSKLKPEDYSERELLLNAGSKFKVVGKSVVEITNWTDKNSKPRKVTQLDLELMTKASVATTEPTAKPLTKQEATQIYEKAMETKDTMNATLDELKEAYKDGGVPYEYSGEIGHLARKTRWNGTNSMKYTLEHFSEFSKERIKEQMESAQQDVEKGIQLMKFAKETTQLYKDKKDLQDKLWATRMDEHTIAEKRDALVHKTKELSTKAKDLDDWTAIKAIEKLQEEIKYLVGLIDDQKIG